MSPKRTILKFITPHIAPLVFSILVLIFTIGFYVLGWQEPSQAPPEGNVPTPLNVGSQGQEKLGGLILNTGGAPLGLIVDKGRVGIGTRDPGYTFSVIGDIFASGEIIGKMTKLTKDFVVAPGQTISQGDVVSLTVGGIKKGISNSGFIGIAQKAGLSGETVPVIIRGISNVHSGLASGIIYYALDNGNLTVSETPYKIGFSISQTELFLEWK